MDNGGYTGKMWQLQATLLIPKAVEALTDFQTRNGLSEVDALNWLLQLGGQCAEYTRSGTLIYRDASGNAYRIVPLLGNGQTIV